MKKFITRQLLKRQMKDVPKEEQEKLIKLVEQNPELFTKIGKEVEEKVKAGSDQQQATMSVMMKYKDELQKIYKK